jgi:seryl-tRNA synthetase
MIIAILENYQQQDGTVQVPLVLRKFMWKEIISRVQ